MLQSCALEIDASSTPTPLEPNAYVQSVRNAAVHSSAFPSPARMESALTGAQQTLPNASLGLKRNVTIALLTLNV